MKSTTFDRFAERVSRCIGHPVSFTIAIVFVLSWLLSGSLFHFSNTWHLILNSPTTAITFLIVFIIESTQRRNNRAVHEKLDEVIRALDKASNLVIGSEKVDSEEKIDE